MALDAFTSQEVFRKDHRMILAMNRHQASIVPVRLAYNANGYLAGTVLGRNSVSTHYEAYDDAHASGADTAVGILFNDVLDMPASGTGIGQMIIQGQVFEAALVGLDANAKTDLKSRSVIDGTGTTILIF
jgi:hypothetical protein